MRHAFIVTLFFFILVFTFAACGGGGGGSSASLSSIAVTPANPSLTVGSTQQFTATGTYDDGSTSDITASVTWSSSAPLVVSISTGGLATAIAAPSAIITATSGDISGNTTLTVASLTKVGTCDIADDAVSVLVSGNSVFIGFDNIIEEGMEIVDISNPAAPTLLVHQALAYHPQGFYVVGTLLYIAANNGLYVSDISDPAHPTVPQLIYADNFLAVVVDDDLAYAIGGAPDGLAVISIAGEARLGFYDTPCCTSGLSVNGNHAYVADGPDGGLQIIDVTNSFSPIGVGEYVTGDYTFGVSESGNDDYVYVTTEAAFQVINVTDPAVPALATEFPTSSGDIFVSGNRAFVTSGIHLNMYDVTDPVSPTLLLTLDNPGHLSHGLSGNTTHIVLATWAHQLDVYSY